MSADLTPFVELVRKAKRRLLFGALVPLVLAALAFLLPSPTETVGYVVLYSLVGFCVLLAGLLVWEGLRSPDSHPALVALRSPGEVTWLFLEQSRDAHTQKTGKPTLRVGLRNGSRLPLELIPGREAEMVERARAAAPRATYGWTPDLELAYLTEPASLLRS